MSLIPSGDRRQDPQESLLLKSTMTCFGMQHTSMTPTSLQDKKQRKTYISHQVDNSDESDHEFGEDNLNDLEEDDPFSYSVFNPP